MKKAGAPPPAGDDENHPHSLMAAHLNQEHLAKLRSSALSVEQLDHLQWRSLRDGRLEIDYIKPNGQPEICSDGTPFRRWRSSAHKIARGAPKYISPRGNGCRLYHSHVAIAAGNYQDRLLNTSVPLRITEGELKTEAAIAHDPQRITIGLGGVNSWMDRRDGATSQPLPELEEIPIAGREVRLCFDSDFSKPQVQEALKGLAFHLRERDAHVLVEVLPNGLDGERLGIDDLIHRHGAKAFLAVAAIARSPFRTMRRDGHDAIVWRFSPEPADTRERNTYLYWMHGPRWRRSRDGDHDWQHWCGTHWETINGNDTIAAVVEQFAGIQQWSNRELSTIRSLLAAFRRSVDQAADGDAAAGLVPFRNGCLRLPDCTLVPHDPSHGNTWCLPFDHSTAASCPGIEAFLHDRLGDSDSVLVFRAFCRGVLTGSRLKCFLELTGPSNTGKSVLAALIQAMVGRSNAAAMTLQRFEDRSQRFETLKLRGKRLAVFSECHDYNGSLNNLKAITGGDDIPAEVKGGRHLDITFIGGVVCVGNGPIRASDPSGAVINRRRSLPVTAVVASADERMLLEPDGAGGWRGELVPELPGLVNWCLAMSAEDARKALARDLASPARAEAEMQHLLSSDHLAEWADQHLTLAESGVLRVGVADGDGDVYLFPSYLRYMREQGGNTRPLTMKVFKRKLVDLLRDTLALPLPPGDTSSGSYKCRLRGSVVPGIDWRPDPQISPESHGVIRQAFLRRCDAISGDGSVMDGDGCEMAESQSGDGCDGCDGSAPVASKEKRGFTVIHPFFPIGGSEPQPITTVSSVPPQGSCHLASITDPSPSITPRVAPPADALTQLQQLRQERPSAHPYELAIAMDPDGSRGITGRKVKGWLAWLDQQAG